MADVSLASLQGWIQQRVTAGAWGVQDVAARDVVVHSSTLGADERLGIYARSYVLRLAECLRAEFPVLRSLIGKQVFDLFAGGYLSAYPPSSPSLYDLGSHFADYLESTRPQPHSGPGTIEALPASLARLERAISVSSRARGPENGAAAGGEALDFAGFIHDPSIRLRTPESLKLLRLDFDFIDALESERSGRRPDPPPARKTLVAVARVRYRVRVHRVEPLLFTLLEALRDHDGDVPEATRHTAMAAGLSEGAVLASLLASAHSAIELGFLIGSRLES